jgi:L-fuconolactonase
MITDAQVHVWLPESPDRGWEPNGHTYAHRPSFLVGELLAAMDGAGVDRAVIVPPGWEGDRNDYAIAAAEEHPSRLAVMIRLAVTHPLTSSELATLVNPPGVVGVRLTFTRGPARAWLADGTADWLWPLLEEQGVPLAIYAAGNLPAVRRIATRHPGLRVMLDHAGLPLGARGTDLDSALAEACALADLPNVALKATSLPSYASDDFPYASLHAPIRRILDAYGPDRVFWGSDLTRLSGTYADAVRLFTEAIPLSEQERRLVMGAGVAAWLDW